MARKYHRTNRPFPVTIQCEYCRLPFEIDPSRLKYNPRFCSAACYHKSRTKYRVYAGAGVYVIKHLPTGRVYVGSSKHCRTRWGIHLCDLRSGKHASQRLQSAWEGGTESEFTMIVLARIDDHDKRQALESEYIRLFDSVAHGFNQYPNGYSGKGYKARAESRARMSAAQQGTRSIQAKLTEATVRRVRSMRASGMSQSAIARALGVTYQIIHGVCSGRRYRNVI